MKKLLESLQVTLSELFSTIDDKKIDEVKKVKLIRKELYYLTGLVDGAYIACEKEKEIGIKCTECNSMCLSVSFSSDKPLTILCNTCGHVEK